MEKETVRELSRTLQEAPERFVSEVRALAQSPEPVKRDELMNALLALRSAMRVARDDRREEVVLDALDLVVGWCSPGSQLFPDG